MSNSTKGWVLICALLVGACGKKNADGNEAGKGPAGKAGDGKPAPGEPPKPVTVAPPRAPDHPVFVLADNRLLAHLHRNGGLVVDAGAPGIAKYQHMNKPHNWWGDRRMVDGHDVVMIENYSPLELPLDETEAGAKQIFVRVKAAAGKYVMTFEANGKSAGNQPLAAGWQTLTYNVPAGGLKAGENVVRMTFTKGATPAVDWVQIGGTAPVGDAESLAIHDAKDGALILPKGGGLSFYVQIPKGGALAGDVLTSGCAVDVSFKPSDGAAVTGKLEGKGFTVALDAASDKIGRLDLGNTSCPEARLTGGALVIPGAAATVARPSKPKHVVLWINDSLRADRIKVISPDTRVETPTYTALASRATWFKNTYVQGNESRASHATIWTSTYPAIHRMITSTSVVAKDMTTIDEAMKKAGFYTAGVSANGFIIPKWGYGDTWDTYTNTIHTGGGVRGEDVLALGIKAVDAKATTPYFLYMGLIDNHVSWRAKQPWMAKYDPKPYDGKYADQLAGIEAERISGKVEVSERDKTHVIAIYDSNVSYADDLMGKFLKQLETWKIADDTMIVMTGDHGDEMWEDGLRIGHGGSERESLVHVPLMISYPPLFPAGVVDEGTEAVDILPTIIDAVGGTQDPQFQGESLIALAQGVGRGYPRPSFSSKYEDAHVMRLGDWKIYAGGATTRLFHISKDPEERDDLIDKRPIERRFVMDSMSTFLIHQKEWKKSRWGVVSNALPAFAADLETPPSK